MTRPLLALLAVAAGGTTFAAEKPPNVVVILSDDMGFSDLGCYGGEIATPNLDALAAGGVRFAQFYNTARCCPTRASLLTGLYPHQAGVGHMMDDKGAAFPGYRGNLNASCRTIAEVLKPAGYRTYALGKWHVTRFAGKDGPKGNWPTHRGFDRYYGTIICNAVNPATWPLAIMSPSTLASAQRVCVPPASMPSPQCIVGEGVFVAIIFSRQRSS